MEWKQLFVTLVSSLTLSLSNGLVYIVAACVLLSEEIWPSVHIESTLLLSLAKKNYMHIFSTTILVAFETCEQYRPRLNFTILSHTTILATGITPAIPFTVMPHLCLLTGNHYFLNSCPLSNHPIFIITHVALQTVGEAKAGGA